MAPLLSIINQPSSNFLAHLLPRFLAQESCSRSFRGRFQGESGTAMGRGGLDNHGWKAGVYRALQ